MKAYFFELVDFALGQLTGTEVLLLKFDGEASDFVRFNHGRVRQPLSVTQNHLALTLIQDQRQQCVTFSLTGNKATDCELLIQQLGVMRYQLPNLPIDPYLLYATDNCDSDQVRRGVLPTIDQAIGDIVDQAGRLDLVGILSSGPIYRGFANSLGQRNWHEVDAFLFDWSIYQVADKAIKMSYSGTHWDRSQLRSRIESARTQLPYLEKAAVSIEPGEYPAYLSAAAVNELLGLLNWSGFSAKEQHTQQSVLQALVNKERTLSPHITLRENTQLGLAPVFDSVGFVKPDRITLIDAGQHASSLISPRTAKEYGLQANGANESETTQSLELLPGMLDSANLLEQLDEGIYVSNLHYLNFSDRTACRMTGLTRFATFWVEQGEIVAPLNVMRFDDSLYRMLSSHLMGLTRETEWLLSSDTYGQRSVRSSRVPGALLSKLRLTL